MGIINYAPVGLDRTGLDIGRTSAQEVRRVRRYKASESIGDGSFSTLVRDDFGQLIVDLLSSAHAQGKGASLKAGPIDPLDSSLSSLASSPRTIMESPATLGPTRLYSEVVHASSPVSDQDVVQEGIIGPEPIVSSADNDKIELAESKNERAEWGTVQQPEFTSGDEDDDNRPWIQVFCKGRNRAKMPERLSSEPIRTSARRNFNERASQTEPSSEEEGGSRQPNNGLGTHRQYQDIFEQAVSKQRAIDLTVKGMEDRLRKEFDQKLKEVLAKADKLEKCTHLQEPKNRANDPVKQLVRGASILYRTSARTAGTGRRGLVILVQLLV
ncbi:hypothetical protein EV702DRAFT_1047174 [Suillus placidus]|uniref:Uncharacterized protein n=1 Tax=Suillus placidus TaxID=48579 RepID=A0A9P7CZX0_9AGAM|nr:hypothetical protein EV702DRAFT_1047174 [Suillus placidus]